MREYYSSDSRVRRRIRKHNEATERTLAQLLQQASGAGPSAMDTSVASTLMGSLIISTLNFYGGLSAKERVARRQALLDGVCSLLLDGIAAVRTR